MTVSALASNFTEKCQYNGGQQTDFCAGGGSLYQVSPFIMAASAPGPYAKEGPCGPSLLSENYPDIRQ